MARDTPPAQTDLLIVGAGAAGLMTAIWAGRTHPGRRIVLVDGAQKLGAKILVAGGGRCNVTHHAVSAEDYAGGSPNTIKKILRRFTVAQTVAFFKELGVELKREPTGKLFPVTDSAQTVLEALLKATDDAGVQVCHPWRVEAIEKTDAGFSVESEAGTLATRHLVLATGGRSLPKTGSDGHGFSMVQKLGHGLTPQIHPALVPLKLDPSNPLCALSGIAVEPVTLSVHRSGGKRLASAVGSVLCTHFGLSGPGVLDISRHWIAARHHDPGAYVSANWLGQTTEEAVDRQLQALGDRTVGQWLREKFPKRFAETLADMAEVDPSINGHHLAADQRRRLGRTVVAMRLEVTGDRGYKFAEVTAGGVPLDQIDPKTMASRRCAGLFLVGEICDVDGRIGGFNFQWAWSSGYVAGGASLAP